MRGRGTGDGNGAGGAESKLAKHLWISDLEAHERRARRSPARLAHVHARLGGACEGPARMAPGEITKVKLEIIAGRGICRTSANLGAAGGGSAGAADVQLTQHRCATLAVPGAVPSVVPPPLPDPWQMTSIAAGAASIAAACAVATPARNACSATSHAAIRAMA